MHVTVLSEPFEWLHGLEQSPGFLEEFRHDWYGAPLSPPAYYALIEDPSHLWLIACRECRANPHPDAALGDFQEDLWRYDVAELFISTAHDSHYLEFNLSPAGAWWAAAFSAPRVPSPIGELPRIRALAEPCKTEEWRAALGIPLDWLRASIKWGEGSRANVSFVLDGPTQRFVSACSLGTGEPDFHRPQHFAKVSWLQH